MTLNVTSVILFVDMAAIAAHSPNTNAEFCLSRVNDSSLHLHHHKVYDNLQYEVIFGYSLL